MLAAAVQPFLCGGRLGSTGVFMRLGRSCRGVAGLLALTLACATSVGPGARAQPQSSPPALGVPMPPPLPPERPPELTPAAPASPPLAAPPVPPERPAELRAQEPPVPPAPVARTPDRNPPILSPPLPPPAPPEVSGEAALALKVAAPDDTACRVRLKRLGAAFEPLPPIANGQCAAASPLKLTALGDGIGLPQSATLVCGAAEALARWATEVQAAATQELGQPLAGIAIGTSYECRGQNHDPDARLSEHAFANGADVMSFSFAGHAPIGVSALPEGTPEARFLARVRGRACGFFRTVLGPGSNAAHATHLHLDERERSGGHRLCQ